MSQRQYEKVSGGNNNKRWEPHKSTNPVYDEKNPAIIEGYYTKISELSGPNGAFNVHEIHTVTDNGMLSETFDVGLGVGLDNTLRNIPLGTFICIEYKGKKQSKTPGRSFNDTSVGKDPNAIPYQELAGKGIVGIKEAAPENAASAVAAGNKNPLNTTNPFPEDNDDLPF